jgi:3-oxoacyl-[acyl-carrier-protein] synthase II
MLAGSSEASVTPLSLALFARIRALSTASYADPAENSRPFDSARDGFVMGEGAGAVVLEELEHAQERGAKILAEVRGYGLSGDASHITAPHHSGRGSMACMAAALRDAGLTSDHIDYINAHATSTPLGDRVEALAIQTLFGEGSNVRVSSTKGALGHMLGAAGSVEAIVCLLALQHQLLPPNLNLHTLEPGMERLIYVRGETEATEVRATMSNSFGFGGTNASLIFTKFEN